MNKVENQFMAFVLAIGITLQTIPAVSKALRA
jgi:hypothetical protein